MLMKRKAENRGDVEGESDVEITSSFKKTLKSFNLTDPSWCEKRVSPERDASLRKVTL